MDVSNRRIVILGKTGAGKSSLANLMFGEELFKIDDTFNSGTRKCKAETRSVSGRNITLIDTPGFFDTERPEEEMRPEIVRCITECAPGPHAFLILFKVEKVTKHEQEVFTKITQYFSEEALKYATVVFTHGEQLRKGQKIEDFVQQNKFMSDLVKKCGGRCHVVDNKYWNENPKDEYRSNLFQVEELLKSIDKMVMENNGSCFTNEMLQEVEEEIQQEEEQICLLSGNKSKEEIREQAKVNVYKKLLIKLAGIVIGVLLGALFGVGVLVGLVFIALRHIVSNQDLAKVIPTVGGIAAGGTALPSFAIGATAAVGAAVAVGAVAGAVKGYQAAEGADTGLEAVKRAAGAVKNEAVSFLEKANEALDQLSQQKLKQS